MRKPDFIAGIQQRGRPACPSHSLISIFVYYFLKNIILNLQNAVKFCLKRPLKKTKKLVSKTDYRLMQVKSIADSVILSTVIKLPFFFFKTLFV